MLKPLRNIGLLCLLALPVMLLAAQAEVINDVPPKPLGPTRYVTDLGHLIPDEQEAALNAYLYDVDKAKIAQIAIVTLPNTDRDLSALSPVIMNQWGIGGKEKDNGLLILANAKRIKEGLSGNRIFVGTGYGLEGSLPDAIVGRILDEQALPAFHAKAYDAGIINTAVTLTQVLQGDADTVSHYSQPSSGEELPPWAIILIILIVFGLRLYGVPIYLGGGGFSSGSYGGGSFGGGRSGGGGAGR